MAVVVLGGRRVHAQFISRGRARGHSGRVGRAVGLGFGEGIIWAGAEESEDKTDAADEGARYALGESFADFVDGVALVGADTNFEERGVFEGVSDLGDDGVSQAGAADGEGGFESGCEASESTELAARGSFHG